MTDEMEDPEEETAEVAQKRKRTTKDKRMTASREKKKKEQNFLLFRYLLLLYNLQHFPRFLKYFQNILSKFNSIFICQIHNINSPLFVDTSNSTRTSWVIETRIKIVYLIALFSHVKKLPSDHPSFTSWFNYNLDYCPDKDY